MPQKYILIVGLHAENRLILSDSLNSAGSSTKRGPQTLFPHLLAKVGGGKWYLSVVPTSLSFGPHSNPESSLGR